MSWRDAPGLVRRDGAAEATPLADARWERLMTWLQQWSTKWGGGIFGGVVRMGLQQARRRAQEDPEGSRNQVIEAVRLVVTALEIEPQEVYAPDEPSATPPSP
jgi:hypothetical protein